jgi:hypothetical protein
MSGAITPLPQYAFTVWCLVKHRDNFAFTFNSDTADDTAAVATAKAGVYFWPGPLSGGAYSLLH